MDNNYYVFGRGNPERFSLFREELTYLEDSVQFVYVNPEIPHSKVLCKEKSHVLLFNTDFP